MSILFNDSNEGSQVEWKLATKKKPEVLFEHFGHKNLAATYFPANGSIIGSGGLNF